MWLAEIVKALIDWLLPFVIGFAFGTWLSKQHLSGGQNARWVIVSSISSVLVQYFAYLIYVFWTTPNPTLNEFLNPLAFLFGYFIFALLTLPMSAALTFAGYYIARGMTARKLQKEPQSAEVE